MRRVSQGAVRRSSKGFTLLEVIVALAVLSLSIGVLFQSFSASLGRLSDAKAEAQAISVAQSVLARVGADIPLRTGTLTGEVGEDIRWRVDIEPYVHDGKISGKIIPAAKIVVTTSWGAAKVERTLRLMTIRLGSRT